ncbi:hypothetical protein SeLEV6574_g07538 [Synchytrium endobioticum]|uniref:Uncharacterized protein n=1 Tax=Synchytrium endobioticum TaxID=286115 RepID=A0A507CKG5_9FUNG|nr:hypothetical protein SeLEV6574_g07538 [Synchytrium endobioticum]
MISEEMPAIREISLRECALVQTGWQVCWRMQVFSLFLQLSIAKHAPAVWDRDYNVARNILHCFLYKCAFAERPRPFKRSTNRVGLSTTLNSSRVSALPDGILLTNLYEHELNHTTHLSTDLSQLYVYSP